MVENIIVIFPCSNTITSKHLERVSKLIREDSLMKAFQIGCFYHNFTIFSLVKFYTKKYFKKTYEFENLKINDKDKITKGIKDLHKIFRDIAEKEEISSFYLPIDFSKEIFTSYYICPLKSIKKVSARFIDDLAIIFCPKPNDKNWENDVAGILIHNFAHRLGINVYFPSWWKFGEKKKKEELQRIGKGEDSWRKALLEKVKE